MASMMIDVFDEFTFSGREISTLASSSVCDSISFVSRDEWGALPSNLTDMRLPVHHVFIHHTFEEECHDQPECSRLMRIMQQFHNVTRGFGDIGYNFIIGGDNNVYVGKLESSAVIRLKSFPTLARSRMVQEWPPHLWNEQ